MTTELSEILWIVGLLYFCNLLAIGALGESIVSWEFRCKKLILISALLIPGALACALMVAIFLLFAGFVVLNLLVGICAFCEVFTVKGPKNKRAVY